MFNIFLVEKANGRRQLIKPMVSVWSADFRTTGLAPLQKIRTTTTTTTTTSMQHFH